MLIGKILKKGLELNASDIILSPLSKPSIKVNGDVIQDESFEIFEREVLDNEIMSIMSEKQRREFVDTKELDFGIDMKGYSRFRVNAFVQRDGYAVVFRPIKSELPTFEQLGVPPQVLDFVEKKHGLILVTGSVGSGKSTTLAALLKHINQNHKKHIITIEDPVEFIHKNDKSLVEQREVGTDTHSFYNGLKYALRQASDVILVGEMRDLETFRLALRAAETGNLVLATLHTSGAARTVSRIIDMFPGGEKEQIKQQLSEGLIGVVWQDLLKRADGKGRIPACEVLVNSTSVSNMIRKGLTHQIDGVIETSRAEGMVTMKKSLEKLFGMGLISKDNYEYNLKYLSTK
ncbi:PilT/PilU family type 4a pilus ATPase [Candidatus Gracilibacteria bacterium]|nr:PilT/PilU family type 4a pilus ATPase [Candidatus Gracilibacteria bacterium]